METAAAIIAFLLTKELAKPKFTDETQRINLRCQLEYMQNYKKF